MLKPGDIAPHFELATADRAIISLNEPLDLGRQVLLVFLRHLG